MKAKRFLVWLEIILVALALGIQNPRASLAAPVTPAIVEYALPHPNSGATALTVGPDGALWFTEFAANRVGRITTRGEITEFDLPTPNSGPSTLVVGPDANLWLIESLANKIARVTAQGEMTEYSIPTTDSSPVGITAGPDGALWFTEFAANRIGRITTEGALSEYLLPVENANPFDIIAGADKALWFTEGSNKIGRMSLSGGFNEYAIPTPASGPSFLAAGADNSIYFAEHDANRLGRINLAGAFHEYDLPLGASQPGRLASSSDGAVWFTSNGGNKVIRLATDGAMSEFALPTANASPAGIAFGPDGNLWFVEERLDKIGKLALDGQPQPLALSLPFAHQPGDTGLDQIFTFFDHEYPTGGAEPVRAANSILLFTGERRQTSRNNCVETFNCYSGHEGYDFPLGGIGSPVLAAHDGFAIATTQDCRREQDAINVVTITQGRYRTVYLHLLGDAYWRNLRDHPRQVKVGERIGTVGNSGAPVCSTGAHLHFETRYDAAGNGNYDLVDPYGYAPTRADPWVSYGIGHPASTWLWDFSPPEQAIASPGGWSFIASGSLRAVIPNGAVGNPTLLALTIAPEPNPARSRTLAVGPNYQLTGARADSETNVSFSTPVSLTVNFADADLRYIRENSLSVYRWDTPHSQWTQMRTVLSNKQALATTNQTGLYSLRGETLYPAPVVFSITPVILRAGVNNTLSLRGAGLLSTPRVSIGGILLDVQYESPSALTVTVPPLASGSFSITVRNPDGQSVTLEDALTVR